MNGPDLNGTQVVRPGVDCKGVQMNGPDLSGTRVVRLRRKCPPQSGLHITQLKLASGVALRSGRLLTDVAVVGTRLLSKAAPDADFTGALLLAGATDGSPVQVRLDAMSHSSEQGADDLWAYQMSYQSGSGAQPGKFWQGEGEFAALCPDGQLAMPVVATWDNRRHDGAKAEVTLSCEGGAMAKCIARMGYRPWQRRDVKSAGKTAAVSLLPYFQACLRAITADYCGNGDALTQSGMTLNLYDGIGVQKDERDWPLEAEWAPDGARCIGPTRLVQSPLKDGGTVQDYLLGHCKDRLRQPGAACHGEDALLFTEIPPAGSAAH